MLNVLYEDNHVLCVVKPENMPVNADSSNDVDLLTLCKNYLKEKYHKPGNVYCGLVHRLDRPVGGVMVFARTSKAASRLSEAIRTHQLKKEYLAVTDGIPDAAGGIFEDYLYKDKSKNMVYITDEKHGKYCRLQYAVLAAADKNALVHILLDTGRSHQIRVQFASRSIPLVHDQKYNPESRKGSLGLYAFRLTFPHPVTKEMITVTSYPPKKDPWNLFEVKHV